MAALRRSGRRDGMQVPGGKSPRWDSMIDVFMIAMFPCYLLSVIYILYLIAKI